MSFKSKRHNPGMHNHIPRTRDLLKEGWDMTNGIRGWIKWRRNLKKGLSRYERHVNKKSHILDELFLADEDSDKDYARVVNTRRNN